MRVFRRMLLAAFLAPLTVVPAVFLAVFCVYFVDLIQFDFLDPARKRDAGHALETAGGLSLIGVPVGWFLAVAFGMPAYALLRLANLDQPVPCALVGAAFGAIFGSDFGHNLEPLFLVVMTTCGATVAAAFSIVVNTGEKVPDTPLYVDESVS